MKEMRQCKDGGAEGQALQSPESGWAGWHELCRNGQAHKSKPDRYYVERVCAKRLCNRFIQQGFFLRFIHECMADRLWLAVHYSEGVNHEAEKQVSTAVPIAKSESVRLAMTAAVQKHIASLKDEMHPLAQRQYKSVYWPLQMGQLIKSLNFSQQQCKCNKRQPEDEMSFLPTIQMH
ncbi:hypothetical protein [Comamonas aquatilis]|uniref:hypothetical protein n=1 Tax=Comamonas aquatilis TaxID=1778406 RepID=UPI0039EEB398